MNSNADHLMQADIPFWFIQLPNGRAYPDVNIGASWLELAGLHTCKFKIKSVGLQFRDHVEIVTPDYSPGYFFIRSAGCWHVAAGAPTDHYFNVGWIENNMIRYGKWKVPELELITFDMRPLAGNEKSILYNG